MPRLYGLCTESASQSWIHVTANSQAFSSSLLELKTSSLCFQSIANTDKKANQPPFFYFNIELTTCYTVII